MDDIQMTIWRRWLASARCFVVVLATMLPASLLPAQNTAAPVPAAIQPSTDPTPLPAPTPVPADTPKDSSPLPGEPVSPINLPTALRLANARPLDIAIAQERVSAAAAQLDLARCLWLPTLYIGSDYFRHDGTLQDSAQGVILHNSHSSVMVGAGPSMVFAMTDAYFAPLAARQVVAAQRANLRAAANDSLLAVAEAYFNVQQARGELAGAEDTVTRSVELVRRAEQLAGTIASPAEATRARAELARRRQAVQSAREQWRTASAELVRILRLDPLLLVNPQEPPQLEVSIVPLNRTIDELVTIALTNRPELAAQQALVQAALQRMRQEKMRPLLPSLLLRGGSTTPSGTLAAGVVGGGLNSSIANFGPRADFDVQLLWELQNLGFGNHARVRRSRRSIRPPSSNRFGFRIKSPPRLCGCTPRQ